VDQIGKQRNRACQDKDPSLDKRRRTQDSKAPRDCLDARARAHDRTVDETVRMTVLDVVLVLMLMLARLNRL
jgi:hypothetical protein